MSVANAVTSTMRERTPRAKSRLAKSPVFNANDIILSACNSSSSNSSNIILFQIANHSHLHIFDYIILHILDTICGIYTRPRACTNRVSDMRSRTFGQENLAHPLTYTWNNQ